MTALRLGGVPEHFNLPWHLALESGQLDHLALEWTDQEGGTGQMLAHLESGVLDIVSILTEGTVAAIAQGLPVTIVQVYVSSPLQWGVHVPANSDITEEAQLENQPIAISRFMSGSHLMAFVQAERNGWTINPDQFQVVGNIGGAREALLSGRALNFLWDRYMTQSLVDSGDLRRVAVHPTDWPSFVIAVRDEALHARTSEVGQVIDAVVAEAQALHGRADVIDMLAARYGLSAENAQAWLEVTSFAKRQAVDPAVLADTLAQLRRAGFTD